MLCSPKKEVQHHETFQVVPPACDIACDVQDEFFDDEYDDEGCLNFIYSAQDLLIFPETPALDESYEEAVDWGTAGSGDRASDQNGHGYLNLHTAMATPIL